ncbi:hypothetical protein SAMN05421781_2640 [Marinococcus luteus]|uniref:Uncharacterized protein n=1 Tax=Marinococcus luteus TaxID=1122204 RepID=A0A1H2X450_9BACI|nr:hypothetical protein [Marinococcus luteus]SDW87660.1 hypothetical protein SAMN05421781_2640 [Marinococcus luteus]
MWALHLVQNTRFVVMGLLSLSALSILAFQSVEIAHAFLETFRRR